VGLRLTAPWRPELDGALAVVWPTTPWTLPSNLAMAVTRYRLRPGQGGERAALPARRARVGPLRPGSWASSAARTARGRHRGRHRGRRRRRATVLRRLKGSELLGLRYTPPVRLLPPVGRTRTGCSPPATSPPRTAPGLCTSRRRSVRRTKDHRRGRIEVVVPVDSRGEFTVEVPPYAGMHRVRCQRPTSSGTARRPSGATRTCRRAAAARDLQPPYPHAGAAQPLIQRAVDSWFVKVTAFRDGWWS